MKKSILFLSILSLFAITVRAQQSPIISYQGVISDLGGKPADGGTYSITISFYSDESGTHPLWQDTFETAVQNGVFNIELGSRQALPAASDMDRPIWVDSWVGASRPTEPRHLSKLGSVPKAINSITAQTLSTDYVASILVNGTKVTGNGTPLNISTGNGLEAVFDPGSNSLLVSTAKTNPAGGKGSKVLNGTDNTWDVFGEDFGDGTWSSPKKVLGTLAHGLDTSYENWYVIVGGLEVFRFERHGTTPDIIGGLRLNSITDLTTGGNTISGGGGSSYAGDENYIYSSNMATIGGGIGNHITGSSVIIDNWTCQTIAGGEKNTASSKGSFVGAGGYNKAYGWWTTIAGGDTNVIGYGAFASAISGGEGNLLTGTFDFTGSGKDNRVHGNLGVIGGGRDNAIDTLVTFATIGGGSTNTISSGVGTIGGGSKNTISGYAKNSFIGGGGNNSIGDLLNNVADSSVIGGGHLNTVFSIVSTIAGGGHNAIGINSVYGFIGGGDSNMIIGSDTSTIGGGYRNIINSNTTNFIGGGSINYINISRYGTIGSGSRNRLDHAHWSGVLGGDSNYVVGSSNSNIVGGLDNSIAVFNFSAIGGGQANYVGPVAEERGDHDVIAGGDSNYIHSGTATIGGGALNRISRYSDYSTISGGDSNFINVSGGTSASYSFIGGGENNLIKDAANGVQNSLIAGGEANYIYSAEHSTITGGRNNFIQGQYSFIGGGGGDLIPSGPPPRGFSSLVPSSLRHIYQNQALGPWNVIGGGEGNITHDSGDVIVGGGGNVTQGPWAAVGGGWENLAEAPYTTVAGGSNNSIISYLTLVGDYSAIGGGLNNAAWARSTAIPGGEGLTAQSYAQFIAGRYNVAQGSSTPSSINPNDFLAIFGNGTSGTPSNAVTISNDGILSVYGSFGAAGSPSRIGSVSAESPIIAWGNVTVVGIIPTLTAGVGVLPGVARIGLGHYQITLFVKNQDGITPHPFVAGGAAVVATVMQPVIGAVACTVVVTPITAGTASTFDVFTFLGLAAADLGFQFHVVAN